MEKKPKAKPKMKTKTGKLHLWTTPKALKQLEAWAELGLADTQIAKNMGIHVSTLYSWQNKSEEIKESLRTGKAVVDLQVQNALLKKALGYDKEEIKTTVNGDYEKTEITIKHYQGDTTAQIFWLKNRMKKEWRDTFNQEITGKEGGPIEINEARERLIEKLTEGKE